MQVFKVWIVCKCLKMVYPIELLVRRRHIYFTKVIFVQGRETITFMLRHLNRALTSISNRLHLLIACHHAIEGIVGNLNEWRVIIWKNWCVRAHLGLQLEFVRQTWERFELIHLLLELNWLKVWGRQLIEHLLVMSGRHHKLLLMRHLILRSS